MTDRRKKFWQGYGQLDPRYLPKISQSPPPEEIAVYRKKLKKILLTCMCIGAALPPILAMIVRPYEAGESLSSQLLPSLHAFVQKCVVPATQPVFEIWFTVMASLAIVCLIVAFVRFPFNALPSMCRRVESPAAHVVTLCICILFSLLAYWMVTGRSAAACTQDIHVGHAKVIINAINNSVVGMALFGPLIWALTVVIWLSTALVFAAGFTRLIFSLKQ